MCWKLKTIIFSLEFNSWPICLDYYQHDFSAISKEEIENAQCFFFFRKFEGARYQCLSKRWFLFIFLAICFSAKDFQVWIKIHFRVSLKCALTIPRFRTSFRLGLAWEIAMFRSFSTFETSILYFFEVWNTFVYNHWDRDNIFRAFVKIHPIHLKDFGLNYSHILPLQNLFSLVFLCGSYFWI